MKKITGAHNRMFILTYLAKNKKWPKCSVLEGQEVTRSFRYLIENRPLVLSEYDLQIPLQDWGSLEFEQIFQFDDYKDITMLLSDTSISPYLPNWLSVYDQDLLNVQKPTNVQESRRVLIELLTRNDISCKKIRETIQTGVIPDKWYIVGLHSKERELKIKARLFSMMCIEMRLYFAMTEKNLAEKIFPYIPYQTMTWTDAELTKVLLDLTGLSRSRGLPTKKKVGRQNQFIYAIVSLDFNKFNQRWRKESTEPIFSIYDQLFGTPGLYAFSHKFFEKAFFYLSSRWKIPNALHKRSRHEIPKKAPKDTRILTELTWLGQGGGCEGLRQKGWTAVIVSALAANEYETGIPSHIIGQGDNQVIVISIRVPTDLLTPEEFLNNHPEMVSRQISAYLDNLVVLTKGCGMDLKLEESWISTKFMNYGKEIIIDGSYTSNVQ